MKSKSAKKHKKPAILDELKRRRHFEWLQRQETGARPTNTQTIRSDKEKQNDPRKQRKEKSWLKDAKNMKKMKKIKISKSDWYKIGYQAGWIKTASDAGLNLSTIIERLKILGWKISRYSTNHIKCEYPLLPQLKYSLAKNKFQPWRAQKHLRNLFHNEYGYPTEVLDSAVNFIFETNFKIPEDWNPTVHCSQAVYDAWQDKLPTKANEETIQAKDIRKYKDRKSNLKVKIDGK